MKVYIFDENTKEYLYEDICPLDPLESKLQQKEVYLIPINGTLIAPSFKEGYAPVFENGEWTLIEDHRGKQYWLVGDQYDSPAQEVKQLGALPDNATFVQPKMTAEQKQAEIERQLIDKIQQILDDAARDLKYDNCLSVCSYVNTGVAKFDAEGEAFRKWRSEVWEKGYQVLDQVLAGEIDYPSIDELPSMIPSLEIEYK